MTVLKTISKYFAFFIVLVAIATTYVVQTSGNTDFHFSDPLTVNDATLLNPIGVTQVIKPTTSAEISSALINSTGPVSIGGARYSMGGQIAYEQSTHFDMRNFKKVVDFDKENKKITVQTGITWRDLQEFIDPHNLSIKIMQTYANFSVGGSLSVNVHGRYIGEGPLIQSVDSIKIILANGEEKFADRQTNSELFLAAIGGYGGIGVISEATLQLVDNEKVERTSEVIATQDYLQHFKNTIRDSSDVVFHNADIYPPHYEKVNSVSWYKTQKPLTNDLRLQKKNDSYGLSQNVIAFIANFDFGKWLRKVAIDPYIFSGEKVVWRNHEASYDVAELPQSDQETAYVLREYFIPIDHFDSFVPKMREIFNRNHANIINVSIRHAHKAPENYLSWAPEEMFAFVVYYQQGTDDEAKENVRKWSTEMIDAVISENGTYYLPYQIFASAEQFLAAYPNSPTFFAVKQKVDPEYRFRNQLWKAHYPQEKDNVNTSAREIKNYFKNPSNSILSVPEWYLVFNPLEYADYLESGAAPNDFPFMASINEYWNLYDRVMAVAHARQQKNDEYVTMLQVIGVSTTAEYMLKAAYENTIGAFTYWTANGEQTEEDQIYAQAQRAYSNLIFDQAWYEFDFWSWVQKAWHDTSFLGPNFIRKTERKLFMTLEFGFKTLYAKLIGYASQSTYEPSDGLVYLTAKIPAEQKSNLPTEVAVLKQYDDLHIISVPRWGKFSEITPQLTNMGVEFVDISGNNKVVTSIISGDSKANYAFGHVLFDSAVVSQPKLTRHIVEVDAQSLDDFIAEVNSKQHVIEHIYDF